MSPKTILVTGCSTGGIGAAVALALAKRSHHVFVTARSVSKIPPALSELSNVTVLPMDVASTSSVAEAAQTVQDFAELLIKRKGRIVNLSTCGAAVNTSWISEYCSSKAALTTVSETLRLELSPFGVSVVTIMAGAVSSHFHDNEPDFKLPNRSYYAPIEEIVAGWASGKSKPGGCSPEQFAESLVEDIVGDDKGG